ncbi:lipid transfer-like protein VAS [Neltuma alba]|uniref:lipid transfer-like protein VAS n=1 Tax=Neltuma alba TaxID=207710 RepID=UPI0010A524D1|nr:lipid transfer-like protein VAS [Prosopis alba]
MEYYSKSNVILSMLFLIFSRFLHEGFSQQLLNPRLSIGNMQCVEKLAPCEPYIKKPGTASGTPPETCCQPLKDMIAGDVECLCNVFNSPEMLQSINATKDDALKLPKACGLDADVSKCNNGASSPTNSSNSGANQTAAADASKSTSSTTMIITPSGLVLTFASVFSAYWI